LSLERAPDCVRQAGREISHKAGGQIPCRRRPPDGSRMPDVERCPRELRPATAGVRRCSRTGVPRASPERAPILATMRADSCFRHMRCGAPPPKAGASPAAHLDPACTACPSS